MSLLEEYFDRMNQGEVIVAYKGSIGADVIAQTLQMVETKLEEAVVRNTIRKRLYNVMVESLQNLFHHVEASSDNCEPCDVGVFILSRTEQGYRISTGNFVQASRVDALKEKIDKINSLSLDELKDFYKFVLNNQKFSEKGGGGLGLIDMARKTGNKLEYQFFEYNHHYHFFNLNIQVTDTY